LATNTPAVTACEPPPPLAAGLVAVSSSSSPPQPETSVKAATSVARSVASRAREEL